MPTRGLLHRASDLLRIEEERQRAWLHDTVLQVLEYVATAGYGTCTSIEQLMQVAANAADNLRDTIEAAPTRPRPGGLRDELLRAVAEARSLTDIPIRVTLGDPVPASSRFPITELVASVREALTNARKHAKASAIDVKCRVLSDRIEVLVVDDGAGFDPLETAPGIGLRDSLYCRMARCGGYVNVSSAPGRGTTVRIIANHLAPALETVA